MVCLLKSTTNDIIERRIWTGIGKPILMTGRLFDRRATAYVIRPQNDLFRSIGGDARKPLMTIENL